MKKRTVLSVAFAMAGSLLFGGVVMADEYPSRPITLVIPYGPGGAADLSARLIAGNAPSTLGQSILPVNKAGAAGVTGSNFVINSKKDGYTLLSARVGSQMGVPAMNKTIPYKWDDFTVIGMTELNPFILTVSADSPYQTFADFEKAVKEGVELTYSSAGVGTLLHIATAVMADAMGADPEKLTHVPYKGGGKARTAVVSGAVDFSWGNLSASAGALAAGQLRALAVTTKERFETIPDVPTASEVGYPNLEQIIGWSAIYGPPDLPDEVVAKWTETLNQLNENAAWLKLTKGLGNIVSIMGPEETKAFVEKQYVVFDEAINKLGMRIE
ncbi:MAG: tripartite tricarboxylate transporter substrate binding protein [Gammaproteobacteria bacterium]|nr:tripartite tricarboxylate transporter substrate binding protein [Gammaproteobacteria bacterium]